MIDSLSRLPAAGMNPDNLISVHALKDWCASMRVTLEKEPNSEESSSTKCDNTGSSGNALIQMHEPKTKDDWFYVIRDCVRAFEKEYGFTPNEPQLWARLKTNPPQEYGVNFDSKKESLLIAGEKPQDRAAFSKRYKRLFPTNSDN
jgi:hypothetical protein